MRLQFQIRFRFNKPRAISTFICFALMTLNIKRFCTKENENNAFYYGSKYIYLMPSMETKKKKGDINLSLHAWQDKYTFKIFSLLLRYASTLHIINFCGTSYVA